MGHRAVFEGLVYDEEGRSLAVTLVAGAAHYVVEEDEFHYHVEAEPIDREVIGVFRDEAVANRELLSTKVMEMMGKDDLFTKVMIEDSLGKMDQLVEIGLPEDARNMLGMVGFRVIIDRHGGIVKIKMPAAPASWDEE
jgi:hypothetical protein